MTQSDTLALKQSDKQIMIAVAVIGGGLVGLALPIIWNAIKDLSWLPFHQVLSAFMSVDSDPMTYLRPLILIVLALAAAILLIISSPVVEVSDEEVRIQKGSDKRVIKRSDVAGVYSKGGKVIIESAGGRRLFDDSIEGGKERVKQVFINHGYPWES